MAVQGQWNKRPRKPQSKGGGSPKFPPFLTFDPSIAAESRAQGRGLKDIIADTGRARGYETEDRNIKAADLGTDYTRGLRDIGYRQQDILTRQSRGLENFDNQLTGLIRNFQVKGREQQQAQNAAGVLGGSAPAAAAARRREGFNIGRKPIDLGRQRLVEDSARDMSRLVASQGDLTADYQRGSSLSDIDFGRTMADLDIKERRAVRERGVGKLDLINQAIYGARQAKPGYFDMYGQPKRRKR